jgi:hypothetical protein
MVLITAYGIALYDAGSVYKVLCTVFPIPLHISRLGHSLGTTSHETSIAKINTSSTSLSSYLTLPPLRLMILLDALANLANLLAS